MAELVDALDLKSSCSDTVRVRFSLAARNYIRCGYRIVVIMRPCQGRETGSIPVTRSNKKEQTVSVLFYLIGQRVGIEQVGSETRVEAEAEMSERASDEYPGDIQTPTLDK